MKQDQWGDMGQLRVAAESLADAIELRTRVHNRIRSGSADGPVMLFRKNPAAKKDPAAPKYIPDQVMVEGDQLTEAQIKKHPLGLAVLDFEATSRENLQQQYYQSVPEYVREWASEVPILKSGELFPRIVAMTGNPVRAIPLKMEGEGKARAAVPDGEPYERSLRQFWQWCGRGDPDLVAVKGDQETLLRMGKIKTVSPLLFAFSRQLVMASAKSETVRDCDLYRHYLAALDEARGHDGKCEGSKWPSACAVTHKRHYKTCRNKHIPPMSPNGCGIGSNPEWGEPGAPWRPGHVNMHGHRIVQKELLRDFWALVKNR